MCACKAGLTRFYESFFASQSKLNLASTRQLTVVASERKGGQEANDDR
jgi:hypothetical protein